MIIAVDFDGTCVTHDYPEVGQDIGAVEVLRDLVEEGHKIILWTMRDGETLVDAIEWFENNGIYLWGINENPEQHRWTNSRKAYAHMYIDDAALGIPLLTYDHPRDFVNWIAIREILEKSGILQKKE